jgi:hypothetical protein
VKLVVQVRHLLMQVVIVLLSMLQLLLKLVHPSPQGVLFVLGFIPLVDHMNEHALAVPVGNGLPLKLLYCLLISLDHLISL